MCFFVNNSLFTSINFVYLDCPTFIRGNRYIVGLVEVDHHMLPSQEEPGMALFWHDWFAYELSIVTLIIITYMRKLDTLF